MASKTEQRKIQIIADGSSVNASMQQMQNAARLLWNDLKKLPETSEEFVKKSEEYQKVKNRLDDTTKAARGTESALTSIKNQSVAVAGALGLAFGVNTIVGFLKSSSNAAKDFEKALSSLSSITGAVGDDLEFYKQQAVLIGETTTLSASQAVDAFTLIGSKKPELLSSKEALVEVTSETVKLAEAAGITLPAAADAMTQMLNKFDLDASESARVADVLAASFKNGSVDIQQTAAELAKFGGIANAQKISLEQSAAAIQVVGKTVDESGVKLRNILLTLASGADETNPSIVGLENALENLGKQNLSTAELSKIFGTQNAEAALQMIKNRGEIIEMTEKVKEQGIAAEMAAINTNNLDGTLKSLDSVVESIKISFGQFINSALTPVIKGFIQFLLLIKEIPRFISENREYFIALGAAVITLNAANIAATASTLGHLAAEKGRAIATNASAVAQRLLNAAMNANPIGIIITVVGTLVAALANLYRTNENVRAGINALWDAAKTAFFGIKELAIAQLGGINELLVGIFTLDINKIKSGWSSITDSASEFGSATVNAFKDSYVAGIESGNKEIIEKHQEGADSVVSIEEEKNNRLKETDKERKARLKKEQEERKRLQDDFAKKEVEAQKAYEDLQIALMDEGIEKKVAKLTLEHQRSMAELDRHREEILANTATTEEQKGALLESYRIQEDLKDQEYRKKKSELEEEEHKRKLQNDLEKLTEEEAIKGELIDQQFMNAINAEWQRNEARLNLDREFVARRLEILEKAGKGETAQAEKLRTALLRIDKEIADGKIAEAQRAEDFKYQIQQMGFEAARGFMQLGLELMGEEAKGRKNLATVMKAVEIGQITMQGIKEVQSIWAGAATLGPIAGPIVGALQTGIAVARTGLAINKIRTAKYAKGGATGSGQLIDMMIGGDGTWRMPDGRSTRNVGSFAKGGPVGSASFGVIGEAGAEWVGPNWMLRSPKYANIFGYLEAERRKATPFAMGGATASGAPQISQNSSATQDLQQFMAMKEQFGEMRDVLEDIRSLLEAWPQQLRVVNDPRDILDGVRVLNEIEADSRINR